MYTYRVYTTIWRAGDEKASVTVFVFVFMCVCACEARPLPILSVLLLSWPSLAVAAVAIGRISGLLLVCSAVRVDRLLSVSDLGS